MTAKTDVEQILAKLERIHELPTLPAIVIELNRKLQNHDTPVDHAMIGGLLARKWQLPVKLAETIRHQIKSGFDRELCEWWRPDHQSPAVS